MLSSRGILGREEIKKVIREVIGVPKREGFSDKIPLLPGRGKCKVKISPTPELYRISNEDLYMEGSQTMRNYPSGASSYERGGGKKNEDGRRCKMSKKSLSGEPMVNYSVDLGVNPRIFVNPVIAPRLGETYSGPDSQGYFSYPNIRGGTNFSPIKDLTEVDWMEQPLTDVRQRFEGTVREGFTESIGIETEERKGFTKTDPRFPRRRFREEVIKINPRDLKDRVKGIAESRVQSESFEDDFDPSKLRVPDLPEADLDGFESKTIDLRQPEVIRYDESDPVRFSGGIGDAIPLAKLLPEIGVSSKPRERFSDDGKSKKKKYSHERYSDMEETVESEGLREARHPHGGLLLPVTPDRAYSPAYFLTPDNRTFIQDIEPNVFSYTNQQTPITYNLGITETPQIPSRDQEIMATPHGNFPLFTRIDPQLVRDDAMPGDIVGMPRRSPWSEKFFDQEAGKGTINYEDIYDGKHYGAGDAYRSYSDVNLGQVSYFLSDIQAYTRPNFIIRNKVSHIDFKDPNGKISPYYLRDIGLDDIKSQVELSFLKDSIEFREDMMERLMRKRNSELYQLREQPLSRQAYNTTISQ